MMEWLVSLCFMAVYTLLVLGFVRLLSGHKDKPKKQMPPGPWTLPVIGNLHHLIRLLPHRAMHELSRRHGPLMLLKLGEVTTLVVSSAEVAEVVMKNHDLVFASRSSSVTLDIFGCGGKDIAFAPYGAHWRQMRKICVLKLLSSNQVNRMESIRAEELGSLLRHITTLAGATINFSEKMTALNNSIVSRAVFGGKFAKQGEYLCELDKAFKLVGGFCLVDLFPSSRLVRWLSTGERNMKRSYGRMERIVAEAIEGRKATRADIKEDEDLLGLLLRLQQEDSLEFPLTTETIGAVLFDMFSGATETTGTVLAWAMSELIRSPETMAKAQHEVREVLGENRDVIISCDLGELHYMRMVIKEVLRLHPPGPLIPRRAREDCKVMGYEISKDTNVCINLVAISQDPARWTNPDEFKPERFENNNLNYNGTYFDYIPFGAGRRQCPGIQFGSAVMEMALTNFLYHFDWILPDGASLASFDMSEKFGLTITRRYDLLLRAIPHQCFKAMPTN
ncbi:unnamed protein product [Alopecurus aequalis]